jgi:hypothetical protein
MGYEVRGVIAQTAVAQMVAAEFGLGTRAVDLEQGYALVPYNDAAYDHFLGRHREPRNPFRWLDSAVADRLATASLSGPLAYVEAEYFGGTGEQHAAVWDGGALAWGPLGIAFRQAIPPQGTAISQALRRIGVTSDDKACDEFEAVGLRRHRHLEDWLPDMEDDE